MMNKVRWTIDNELDAAKFERLSVDLLGRHGFLDIVPIEPQDGGRDAEDLPRKGRDREGHPAYFQFSMEKDWKVKLRRTAQKLVPRKSEFDTFVFVTNQKARGVDIDELKTEFRVEYGWTLVVFSREWLRHQLEEPNADLAVKYLGADVLDPPLSPATTVLLTEPESWELTDINRLFEGNQTDAAVLQLKKILERDPGRPVVSQLLAYAYYKMYRYDEALTAINRAIKQDDRPAFQSIRACILAETGIRDSDRSLLLEARRIFEAILESQPVPTWHILYNLANVLSALGHHEDAIQRYRTAIDLDKRQPTVWKNLASAYHHVGNHDEEMKCFDQALELDPQLPEALISRANSLMVDFQKPEEAIPLLELVLTYPASLTKWPHICYRLALAHGKLGHLEKALDYTEQGLAQRPSDFATRRLKSHLLRKLVRQDPAFRARAHIFWKQELEDEPLNFDARKQLARSEAAAGNDIAAWKLIDESYNVLGIPDTCTLRMATFPLETCLAALHYLPQYAHFRSQQPISGYWDRSDPLFDLRSDPPPATLIDPSLRTYLAVPFGVGVKTLNSAKDRNAPATLVGLFDNVRDGIRIATSQAVRFLAKVVAAEENDVEALATKTTDIMMFMALLALREFGKQRGYIMGYFSVSDAAREQALLDYDENRLHTDVLTETLRVLNEELNILRT
jgi:tetratricopeptide (TPR) repeat protein